MPFNTTQGHVSTIETKINGLEEHLDAKGDAEGLALARGLHAALNEAHADFVEKYPDEAGEALLRSGGTGKDEPVVDEAARDAAVEAGEKSEDEE